MRVLDQYACTGYPDSERIMPRQDARLQCAADMFLPLLRVDASRDANTMPLLLRNAH